MRTVDNCITDHDRAIIETCEVHKLLVYLTSEVNATCNKADFTYNVYKMKAQRTSLLGKCGQSLF